MQAARVEEASALPGTSVGNPPCWQHTLCVLLSHHIWVHLGHASKQQLRLVSKALRREVDLNVSHLEVLTPKDVMRLPLLPWQLKSLAVYPAAVSDMEWLYLKVANGGGGLGIANNLLNLQALVIYGEQLTKPMQQVLEPRLGHLTRFELLPRPDLKHQGVELCQKLDPRTIPWAWLGNLETLVIQVKEILRCDLRDLVEHCGQLRRLELEYLQYKGPAHTAQASMLAALGHLTHLKLVDRRRLFGENLEEALTQLPGLRSLHITDYSLQLARIANLQHLTSLRVTDVNLQGADLEQLAKMEGLQHLAAVQSNLRSNYDCGASAGDMTCQAAFLNLTRLQHLRSLTLTLNGSDQVILGHIAALTQLTRLELDIGYIFHPEKLTALSALRNLQSMTADTGALASWLQACVVAWPQLRVLDLPAGLSQNSMTWGDVQALASLPHLHSLTCQSMQLKGDRQVCYSALCSLSLKLGFLAESPAALANLSMPQLQSVRGKLDVQLRAPESGDEEFSLSRLRQAAAGILQWCSTILIGGEVTSVDGLAHMMQALAAWRPLQRGHPCRLYLQTCRLRSGQASAAALSFIPPAVQELRLPEGIPGEALAVLASHPSLDCLDVESFLRRDVQTLMPLVHALSQQPPGRPLVVSGIYRPDIDLFQELARNIAGAAGGRTLVPLPYMEHMRRSSEEGEEGEDDYHDDDGGSDDED